MNTLPRSGFKVCSSKPRAGRGTPWYGQKCTHLLPIVEERCSWPFFFSGMTCNITVHCFLHYYSKSEFKRWLFLFLQDVITTSLLSPVQSWLDVSSQQTWNGLLFYSLTKFPIISVLAWFIYLPVLFLSFSSLLSYAKTMQMHLTITQATSLCELFSIM